AVLTPDRRQEGADQVEVRIVQLRQGPFPHLELLLGDRLGGVRRYLEEEGVAVSKHRLTAKPPEPVERLRRLRAALSDVAEADDLVDDDALDIRDHGIEGDVVAVLVRDQ